MFRLITEISNQVELRSTKSLSRLIGYQSLVEGELYFW